ncbi:hypothetical protein [Ruegeria arenilitoris]|uniref:hypothetical protein n=1 Tax=Ruegeria arenilitoris TaxID=1173585 RepID=UPI0014813BE7|nr:hypothetical protein [Ruegeria arenilitoris]
MNALILCLGLGTWVECKIFALKLATGVPKGDEMHMTEMQWKKIEKLTSVFGQPANIAFPTIRKERYEQPKPHHF